MCSIPLFNQLHISEPSGCNTVSSLQTSNHLFHHSSWHEPDKRATEKQPFTVILHDVPSRELRFFCSDCNSPVPDRVPVRAHATDGLILLPIAELPEDTGDETEPVVLYGFHGHEPLPHKVLKVRI